MNLSAPLRMVRWGAVIPLLILFGLLAIFILFFLDSCAKWAIQKGGESIFGARVDIASVDVRVGKSALILRGVAVADKTSPMTNLFEFSESAFDFETLPFFEKKIIIDQASLAGLRVGTPRKTSGALPFVEKKPGFVGKAAGRLASQVETFSLGKIDAAKQFVDPKTV